MVACGASPEEIAQTVQQTVEARPPEVVEEEVEVTRIVEVDVPVEVEVTRVVEVEATVEVEVEVTRIVEVEITSTPEPTPTATATPLPQPTAVPQPSDGGGNTNNGGGSTGDVNAEVLATLEYMKSRMDEYQGNLSGGSINCTTVVGIADEFVTPRQFDLSNATAATQNGYTNYVNAINAFQNGTRDLNIHCRNFLADPGGTDGQVSNDKFGLAFNGVEEALGILRNIISALGGNPDA